MKQGAKINAVGTPDKPIIMTSEKKNPVHGAVSTSAERHTPTLKAVKEALK